MEGIIGLCHLLSLFLNLLLRAHHEPLWSLLTQALKFIISYMCRYFHLQDFALSQVICEVAVIIFIFANVMVL